MGPLVTKVTPLASWRLRLEFDNGEVRVFDVQPYLDIGVFRRLRDGRFAAVRVVSGSVEWPGEIDLSYDTLYVRSTPAAGVDLEAA